MYNDQLVYKVNIWAFFGISLWTEKVALKMYIHYVKSSRIASEILLLLNIYHQYASDHKEVFK